MTINKDVWTQLVITPETSLEEGIEKINQTGINVLLVVNKKNSLAGVITDGNIRRHLLQRGDLRIPAKNIMNSSPKVGAIGESRCQWLSKIQAAQILHLPIVDKNNCVVGLETLATLIEKKTA